MLPLIILALVQGLTEFLPVSSSGHLVIAKKLLGFSENGIGMELWLHFATLVALVVYFWHDLARLAQAPFLSREKRPKEWRWVPLIVLSTAITGAIGIVFRKFFVSTFDDMGLTLWGFIVTAAILVATRWSRETGRWLGPREAVFFALSQSFSILPSISRSGMTIACLLFMGVKDETAFRFSFLASIPVIAGAFILELGEGSLAAFGAVDLAASFAVAFTAGIASLYFLRRFVSRDRFHFFGYYCLALAIAGFIFIH